MLQAGEGIGVAQEFGGLGDLCERLIPIYVVVTNPSERLKVMGVYVSLCV